MAGLRNRRLSRLSHARLHHTVSDRGGERDGGFLQVYHANCDDFWVRFDVPKETFGLDLAIGAAAARNRGVGRAALRLIIARLFQWPDVRRVRIDPDHENARAVRAFAAAGFVARGVYPGYDGDTMLYMMVER